MVLWLIGLSGAGKSTLASSVVAQLRKKKHPVALLDGDDMRKLWGNDLGYTMEDRKKNADRICRMGQFLELQGIDVVCAILSMFPESRQWNRSNLRDYFEVFINAPMAQLIQRDSKGLYRRALSGELSGVVGVDLEFPIPEGPDLVIENNKGIANLLDYTSRLCDVFIKQ
jgi:adenylylsulfate kinase-like enzyme